MAVRHFVKYTFLKLDPAWRRLDDEDRARDKREFIAACEDFADDHLLQSFSLVGTRGDCDLMLIAEAENLDRIHEFHVVLAQSGLMKWATSPLLVPRHAQGPEYSDESRLEIRAGPMRYLFVYPFVKTRAWYALPADERWRIMQEHIKVGREFPDRRPQHLVFVRPRRPGVRRRVRDRPAVGLPRPRAEAPHDRVEPLHQA